MVIDGMDIRTLRHHVTNGNGLTKSATLQLIDYALACAQFHDDERIANEHASMKMMRGLLVSSVISLVGQFYFFRWVFLSSGWF